MGNRVIISDLDGTISDPSHRLKLYQQKEYKAFNKAGKDDAPLENTCNLLRSVSGEGADVVIITARDESCRKRTLKWLRLNDVPCDALLMRGINDTRSDAIVKKHLFDDKFLKLYDFKDVWFVLEDRVTCVDMWRGEGLTCFQVAPGDY